MNFVEEEEAGRTTLQGGDRSDEDHPSIFQKARDKKKKMLDLIRPPVAVCGPNMSNFHSPIPSHPLPPPLATWYTCICMIFEFSM